jgi:hypothetical protein
VTFGLLRSSRFIAKSSKSRTSGYATGEGE